ncbi:nicotinate phosphoribosyltransferase [Draconibacterium halophilum]|uniref:Nicotinate phosphoribosyltransferase n=1 Tax=Draconibacterium halophilum TaxID=2706887 RepID=A0A6C0RDJ4_9BACT|nr:nicotinate phosphoribosyltransferase [Draconibacterium halophilum]QIA07221.1 nicotinate phosphoribosyltransferase [Draconibacterium halophilum]
MASIVKETLGLYTDFYELTMAQGYFFCHKKDQQTSFDYYFRTNPYKGGYTVFAGLQDFIDALQNFTYSNSDLEFLKANGFKDEFLDYLRDFKFSGNIYSVKEGEIVFPNEPILSVEGNIIECQLLESILLNILNFQSLIATKAFRIKHISGQKLFADFGLRRAQGFSAIHASRAACIGGASSTSNTLAGKIYNIPVSGTMAHSWVQSFDSELEAFRAFAETNPNNTILLVDTYNTLKSGVPNAITMGHEMAAKGQKLKAIRLDSGDLAYLSKKARKMLDEAGLKDIQILASNQLNEYVIKTLLLDQNAAIDGFGIGTEMITGKSDAALDGVYKLCEIDGKAKMKFSENIEKITLPGKKQLLRYFDEEGNFYRDGILLQQEQPEEVDTINDRIYPEKNTRVSKLKFELIREKVVEQGNILLQHKNPVDIHEYLKSRAALLPDEHKRFISPHLYKVGISNKLMASRNALTQKLRTLH